MLSVCLRIAQGQVCPACREICLCASGLGINRPMFAVSIMITVGFCKFIHLGA